jgi:transposase
MPERVLLTDAQWARIEPLLPTYRKTKKGGRPPVANPPVLEGILYVLKTGIAWMDLPRECPSYATCWRRLKQWEEAGVLEKMWRAFLRDLDVQGTLDWEECMIDATFCAAKKGVSTLDSRGKARGRKSSWYAMHRAFQWACARHLRTLAKQHSPNRPWTLYESHAGMVHQRLESRV